METTADGPAVLRKEIYNTLKDGGINMKTIDGLECFSKTTWYVVFNTRQARLAAKGKKIKLYNKEFVLEIMEVE